MPGVDAAATRPYRKSGVRPLAGITPLIAPLCPGITRNYSCNDPRYRRHHDQEVRSRMGTSPDREQHETRKSAGSTRTAGVVAIALLALVATLPGIAVAVAFAILAYEIRRVRVKIFVGWAIAITATGIALAGFSPTTWLYWSTSFATRTWLSPVAAAFPADSTGVRGWMHTHTGMSYLEVAWTQLWFGAPLGFLAAIVFIVAVRSRPRALRGRIEGDEHSNMRPIGFLDRRRRTAERRKIAAGHYTGN